MKKRILCYGDSNTWGYIAGSGKRFDEGTRWTGLLQKLLGSPYTVIEEGLNARRTAFDAGFDDDLNGLKTLGCVLKTQKPLDAVVVFLGTNDLYEHNAAMSARGLAELIRQIKNADYICRTSSAIYNGEPKILVICPTVLGKTCSLGPAVIEESKNFAKVYGEVTRNLGVEFLNIDDFAETSEIDGMHLTAKTHMLLARAVFDRLVKMGL